MIRPPLQKSAFSRSLFLRGSRLTFESAYFSHVWVYFVSLNATKQGGFWKLGVDVRKKSEKGLGIEDSLFFLMSGAILKCNPGGRLPVCGYSHPEPLTPTIKLTINLTQKTSSL